MSRVIPFAFAALAFSLIGGCGPAVSPAKSPARHASLTPAVATVRPGRAAACLAPPYPRSRAEQWINQLFHVCREVGLPPVTKREAIAAARPHTHGQKVQSADLVRLTSLKRIRYTPLIRGTATWIVQEAPSGICLQNAWLVNAETGRVFWHTNLRADVPCY